MLSQVRLKERLVYEPATGIFTWRDGPKRGKQAGERHSAITNRSIYLRIRIDGKPYMAHRLVWLYVYGHWPVNQIDHINRRGTDNRLENLRDVTQSVNRLNQTEYSNNNSGMKGVNPQDGGWRVEISKNNKKHYIGFFATKELAMAARKAAEIRLYGEAL